MSSEFDIIVIGAGIAGASVAAHLASTHRVAICEMEERPGYHTTGRSAAAYEPNYGPPPILALTRAARAHFESGGYLTPRETVFFMPEWQEEAFAKLMAVQQGMREISVADAKAPLSPAEGRLCQTRRAGPRHGRHRRRPAAPVLSQTVPPERRRASLRQPGEGAGARQPVDGPHGLGHLHGAEDRQRLGRLGRRGGRHGGPKARRPPAQAPVHRRRAGPGGRRLHAMAAGRRRGRDLVLQAAVGKAPRLPGGRHPRRPA